MAEQIVFEIPGPDAPGFLRRQRRYSELQRLIARGKNLEEGGDPEEVASVALDVIDHMVDFMLDYVVTPERDVARDLLLDMSEKEFYAAFEAFGKNAIRRTSQNSDRSGDTTKTPSGTGRRGR